VTANPAAKRKKPSAGISFLLDFGPLLVFFLAFKLASGPFIATGIFMVAIVLAVLVSKLKLGFVSPMLWISAVLVVGFGALTLLFHDPRFIQMKPTFIYAGFSILLFAGLAVGRPLLKYVFHLAFEGLNDKGWMKLSLNWALFFAFMAVLNEVLRAWLTFDTWLTVKVWGVTALSMVFAFANIPMLMRHGFSIEDPDKDKILPDLPPVPPQS
jgi:intracellular septation protein